MSHCAETQQKPQACSPSFWIPKLSHTAVRRALTVHFLACLKTELLLMDSAVQDQSFLPLEGSPLPSLAFSLFYMCLLLTDCFVAQT